MKSAKIVWAIVTNLLAIAMLLNAFSAAYEDWQTIIISMLIIIYIDAHAFFIEWRRAQIRSAVAIDDEFTQIKKLLGMTGSSDDIENNENEKKLVLKKLESAEYYINMTGILILFLIAIANLMDATL